MAGNTRVVGIVSRETIEVSVVLSLGYGEKQETESTNELSNGEGSG